MCHCIRCFLLPPLQSIPKLLFPRTTRCTISRTPLHLSLCIRKTPALPCPAPLPRLALRIYTFAFVVLVVSCFCVVTSFRASALAFACSVRNIRLIEDESREAWDPADHSLPPDFSIDLRKHQRPVFSLWFPAARSTTTTRKHTGLYQP